MAYISFIKLSESEFDNIVSIRDKLQNKIINQLKLQIHDIYEKDEKTTTNVEAVNDGDIINKSF